MSLTSQQLSAAVEYNRTRSYTTSCWKKIQHAVGVHEDGKPGPVTTRAIAEYQDTKCLDVDGKAGPKTLDSMGVVPKYASSDKYGFEGLVKRFPDLAFGIDISDYQGKPNFDKVKQAGVEFCIVKATEGRTHKQKLFDRSMDDCLTTGIPVSAYHLARLTDRAVTKVTDVIGGLDNFLEQVDLFHRDFTDCFDLELKQVKQMVELKGRQAAIDWIVAWIEGYQKELKRLPMIYWSRWTVRLLFEGDCDVEILNDCPTWWADYTSKTWGQKPDTAGWDKWDVRQFTASGKVPGIGGDCDLDYFNGDISDFLGWLNVE